MHTTYTPPVEERFSRVAQLVGLNGLERLQDAHVAVVGLGAVGGHALEALARAGVGTLTIVDFDTVHASNLNRQILTSVETVGQPKIDLACARLAQIAPHCTVRALPLFVHTDTMKDVLDGPPDVLIDAIDSLNPKVELLAAAHAAGIPAISSMGAAARLNAGAVQVDDISRTIACPLARYVRKKLRKHGVYSGIRCIFSDEPTLPPAPDYPLPPAEKDPNRRGRARIPLGSFPTIPGIFGLRAAHEALLLLLEAPAKSTCPGEISR